LAIWEETNEMKLKLSIDYIDRSDSNWRDEDFRELISSTLKNPHGYDDVKKFDISFDGKVRNLKVIKAGKEYEVNLKAWKQLGENELVLMAEIWPILPARSMV
jgi:hypothetical protein